MIEDPKMRGKRLATTSKRILRVMLCIVTFPIGHPKSLPISQARIFFEEIPCEPINKLETQSKSPAFAIVHLYNLRE
jgi:hypothetical protein